MSVLKAAIFGGLLRLCAIWSYEVHILGAILSTLNFHHATNYVYAIRSENKNRNKFLV